MANQTANLGLTLPIGTEKVSRQVINTNMGKIDEAIGALPVGQTLQDEIASANEAIANKGTPVYIGSKAGGQEFTLDWNTYDEYYCIAQYGNSTSLQSQCIEQYVRNILSDMGRANCVLCSGQGGIEVQLSLTNQNKLSLSYFGVSGGVYTTTSYLYVWGIKK